MTGIDFIIALYLLGQKLWRFFWVKKLPKLNILCVIAIDCVRYSNTYHNLYGPRV